MMACPFQMINTPCVQIGHILLALAENDPFSNTACRWRGLWPQWMMQSAREVVRSEESAAVGLRNLVTQWHITQKGALSRIPHLRSCLLHQRPCMAPLSLHCRRPGHSRAPDLRMWPVLARREARVSVSHIAWAMPFRCCAICLLQKLTERVFVQGVQQLAKA